MNRQYNKLQNHGQFAAQSVFLVIAILLVSCSPSTITPYVPTAIPPMPTFTALLPTTTAVNTLEPPTHTAKPATSTPQPDRFSFVTNPIDPRIKTITLADVNSGDYAKWLDDWHHCDAPISQYTYFETSYPATESLSSGVEVGLSTRVHGANPYDGYSANDTAHCGIAIFKPSEFNLRSPKGKELDDLYLVTYQYTGPQGEHTYVNTLLSRKALDKLIADGSMRPGTPDRIIPTTYLDRDINAVAYLTNGDTNGDGVVEDSGDYRALNNIIYTMQNVPGINGQQDVIDLYQSIAKNGLNAKFKDTGLTNKAILSRIVGLGIPFLGPNIQK